MTKKEKLIVSAYTGILMTDFCDFHKFVEDLFGRPVWTHEMSKQSFLNNLRNAVKEEFLELCKTES